MDKMPTFQSRDARRLAGFLRNNGPMIAKELEPQMRAVLEEGERLPDLAHLLDVLGRLVIAAQDRVLEKDDDKAGYATEVAVARNELRREAMPVLRSRVKEIRKQMNAHMSRKTIKRILRRRPHAARMIASNLVAYVPASRRLSASPVYAAQSL